MTKTCFKLNQSTEIDHRQLSSTSIGYLQMCRSITRPKVEKIRQSRINKFPRFRSPHLCFGHLIYDSHARKYPKLLQIRSNPMKFIAHAFQHFDRMLARVQWLKRAQGSENHGDHRYTGSRPFWPFLHRWFASKARSKLIPMMIRSKETYRAQLLSTLIGCLHVCGGKRRYTSGHSRIT